MDAFTLALILAAFLAGLMVVAWLHIMGINWDQADADRESAILANDYEQALLGHKQTRR